MAWSFGRDRIGGKYVGRPHCPCFWGEGHPFLCPAWLWARLTEPWWNR